MVDAPEKIWANGLGCYGTTGTDGTEYTRSDLVAELAAENERLQARNLEHEMRLEAEEAKSEYWKNRASTGAVTDAMVEAGLEYYSEGGCGGLADYERREVVEAIIEAALASHPRATSTVESHETANVRDKPEGQQEPVAHAYVVNGECEQIEWGADIDLPDDPALVLLYTLPSEQAVTEASVRAALKSLHENPLSWEHPDAIREALKAAVEAGHD